MSNNPTSTSSLCDNVTFQQFCDLCENIQKQKQNKTRQTEILTKYIDDFRLKAQDAPKNWDVSFFPILRLLLPMADRERGAYGIKENKLAKILIKIIGLAKTSVDSNKLLNFRAPMSSTDGSSDFANVAFYVIKSRLPEVDKSISITSLNKSLDVLALMNATNSPRDLENELSKLISQVTPVQVKWLIRLILKDMKLGISQDRILRCFHDDASDYFDSCTSLFKVCETLRLKTTSLNEIEIELFTACSAMLSKKQEIGNVDSLFRQGIEYHIEKKFDGERTQVHMKAGKFKYFSRNGYDFTNQYGATFNSGLLTKYMKGALSPSAQSFIIDGEMMGWHKHKKCFSSKGMKFDVKTVTENSVHRPCFCVFDILMYNDRVITNLPLKERLNVLKKLFVDREGIILHSEVTPVSTSKEVMDALNKIIEEQDEGLILKDVNSFYKPKSRNTGWYKIKPEYSEGVMSELDLVIIGGNYATNKAHGLVNSFMLGVAVPPEIEGDAPEVFHSVGKVSIGLNNQELQHLCERLSSHWQKVMNDKNWSPPMIKWTKEKPDLWIDPQYSVILQVKATELVMSDAFASNYTLRFPRVERVRYDKPWDECMTTVEFEELTKDGRPVQKLTKRQINSSDLFAPKVIKISPNQSLTSINVTHIANTLSGKELCVLSGDDKSTKEELEIIVLQLGGSIVQNPGPNTWCAIAGKETVKVKNVTRIRCLDVLRASWLRELEELLPAEVFPPAPGAFVTMGPDTSDRIGLEYDWLGDSYTRLADEASLKSCVNNHLQMNKTLFLLPEEMTELDMEIFGHINAYSFLRHSFAYFHEPENLVINIPKLHFCVYSGNVCESLSDESLTHIVCHKHADLSKITKLIPEANKLVPIVSYSWVIECLKKKSVVPADEFALKQAPLSN